MLADLPSQSISQNFAEEVASSGNSKASPTMARAGIPPSMKAPVPFIVAEVDMKQALC